MATVLNVGILLGLAVTTVEGQPVPRKVLALYKGSEGRTEEANEIYNIAQLVLNNLGFVVQYQNAEEPLPPVYDSDEYQGVASWFITDQMYQARTYRQWLNRIFDSGKRVVILGTFGAVSEPNKAPGTDELREAADLLRRLGLRHQFLYYPNRNGRIEFFDPNGYAFERQLQEGEIPGLFAVQSEDPRNSVILCLRQDNLVNDAVVISPSGGYAQSGVIYFADKASGLKQWYLNPYVFFSKALSAHSLPQLDLNTVNGQRTALIHIDGDGFSTISKIDRWHLCAQLLTRRILKKFSLPFSIGLVAAEIDPNYVGNEGTVRAAKEIFRRPNVEAASHGFAHPFDWRTGELELDSLQYYQFDARQEILGSVNFFRHQLLPPWKDIRFLFWSGMANPTTDQIFLAEAAGLLQINGGAGRLREEYPSIIAFAPAYAQIGNRFRINARVSNEYEFTNRWRGPYDGYRKVIESLKFTDGNPPPIPADLYFHLYSLEWEESWEALRDVLRWAEHQPWTFLYASQYAHMVRDFLQAKLEWVSGDRLVIRNEGAVRSLFLPETLRTVDVAASQNILGFSRESSGIRVFLDSHTSHAIQLTRNSSSRQPYLTCANVWIDSIEAVADTLKLFALGYGQYRIRLAGLRANVPYRAVFVSFPYLGTFLRRDREAEPFLKRAKETAVLSIKTNELGQLDLSGFGENRTVISVYPVSSAHHLMARLRGGVFILILTGIIVSLIAYQRHSFFREISRLPRVPTLKEQGNRHSNTQRHREMA